MVQYLLPRQSPVRRWLQRCAILMALSFTAIASAEWAPGLPTGTPLPTIEAADQDGTLQSFRSLRGKKGLLLFFNRSTDW